MVSENENKPKPRKRRRLLWLLALLPLLPLALGVWLLATETGASSVFAMIDSLSGGVVRATGIHGRAVGPLRVDQLTVALPDNRVDLLDLRVDWEPSALLRGRLHLLSLQVGQLNITSRIDRKPEPPKLPERIALPVDVQVDDARINGGTVNRGPVKLAGFGQIAFALDFDGHRYRLQLRDMAAGSSLENGSVATRLSGEATLSTDKPYGLQGSFSSSANAALAERVFGAVGNIGLSGSLAELVARIDLAVNQAPVKGSVTLKPFSEDPLGAAQLTARALDLARLDPKLPRSVLDVDFSSNENGSGELLIRNPEAGVYNERKLPVTSLRVAFRQLGGQLHLDRISAQLGSVRQPAGEVHGKGKYADGALTLALHTDALDAKRLDGRARATRLAGDVELRHASGRQQFSIALSEPLQKQRVLLNAHGTLADDALSIERAELQAGSGSITASGSLGMAGAQAFRAQGEVRRFRLRELGNFPDLPSLDLNASFSLSGNRQPKLEAELAFSIKDSQLSGQPLSGAGHVRLRGDQLVVPDFLLASGANRVQIEGRLSQSDSTLTFMLDAPQLAQLGPGFGGALRANGIARGTLEQPHIDAEWNASKMRAPGALEIETLQGKAEIGLDRRHNFILGNVVASLSARGLRSGPDRLGAVSLQGRFAPAADAPLALDLRAEGMVLSQWHADQLNVTANGTTARHAINATLNEPGQSWQLNASGGLERVMTAPRWQGDILAFNANGRFKGGLVSPATLTVSADQMQLDRFLLDTDSGRIAVDKFSRNVEGIATRGKLERMQLAQLLRYANPAPPVKTDLQFSGEWDVQIADNVSGSASLRRDQGDVTVLGTAPVTLGLRSFNASGSANAGRLALQLQAEGRQLGVIELDAHTQAGSGAQRLSIAQDAPVSGRARIDVPSLSWLGPLLSPALTVDGRLQGDMALAGKFGTPQLSGRINGTALRLAMTDLGIDLREGSLQGEFHGEQLLVNSLAFQGAQGRVTVSGPIDLGGGNVSAQLVLHAERFALLNRADRRVVVSGDSRLEVRDQHSTITGAFTVNSGFFDIGRLDKPQLSDDVVIVGREKKTPASARSAMDISISLGDGVVLKGRGLDALLTGNIRISNKERETPQALGTLNIAKGTFSAYGRELAIEQGLLRFTGALSNPALDILAMRRGQEVEAGVSVRGTVLSPRITLVSEPTVPEAEKLSWLVLGRSLSTASGQSDAGALQSAAAALLSDSAKAGVQSRIASTFGLDTFSVGTSQDTLQQRIVTLGKQISSRLYLSYRQGLESAASVVQLRYALTPKLSVEAEAGTRSALSLFYNIAFD